MKTQMLLIGLAMAGLLGAVAGCSKSESPAPPVETTQKPATPPTAPPATTQPAATAQPAPPLAPAAAANEVKPAPVEAAATAPALAVTQLKNDTPKPASPSPVQTPPPDSTTQPQLGLAALSQDQVVRGLQEALGKGLQGAIARLGHDGGFLTNLNVKIPVPEKLQKVETALRAVKEDKLADEFIATMNHAAEQAVPQAGAVFADGLKQMTIADAKSILAGPNDAATQYFERTTRTNLYVRFLPVVQKATQQTGVTAAYKNFMQKANLGGLGEKLGGLGSALGGSLLDQQSLDLDSYVTNKAMDGLFKMVADEEKQIRQNPIARTSTLLQQVFGALKK